jgi:cytoskeletal protein RodZ
MLEEMRQANAERPPEVVFGPADASDEQEVPAPEPAPVQVDEPVEAPPPLLKPKPARRKKAPSQPEEGSVTTPKRRGLKKADPQPEPEAQAKPSMASQSAAGQEAVQEIAPVVQVPEPIVEGTPPVETQPEPETGDKLWQTWRNRLGSVLAARSKRRTLVQKEPAVPDLDANVIQPAEVLPQAAKEEKVPAAENWTEIFKEIGRVLRERRELLSLHLEEVERNTHVKAHYLDALERGAMDDLPSTVQTRGMLSNYATFLDLDVDALLLRFADALQARHRERNPQKPARKPGQPILANLPPMRSFIAGDLVFGVGIVILLIGFAIWGVSRVLTLQSQQDVDLTAPSISEILLASPDPSSFTPTPTAEVIEAFPGQPTVTVVIPTLNANVNVQVNLVAVERTYMRVIVDGETVFEGRVVPGTAYPFEAVDQVEVLVGSGAAIRVVYNGRDMGMLGSFGQVVSNIYRTGEIITPTGMPTATASITPTPTNTVPPSATSQFTATPGTAAPVVTDTAVP